MHPQTSFTNGDDSGTRSYRKTTPTLGVRGALTWMRATYTRAFGAVTLGSRIPGIPALAAWAELTWQARPGLTTTIEAMHRGKVEVHDLNQARAAPAHTLINLRLTAEQRSGPWTFNQVLRVDSALNHKHIGSVIVGASLGRYYEPGPGRSVYGGVRVSYLY